MFDNVGEEDALKCKVAKDTMLQFHQQRVQLQKDLAACRSQLQQAGKPSHSTVISSAQLSSSFCVQVKVLFGIAQQGLYTWTLAVACRVTSKPIS